MISLRSDNRIVAQDTKFSYLVDNYPSGASSIFIINTEGFFEDDFILIGEFGKEASEIFRAGAVNTTTGEIPLLDKDGNPANTAFAHAESTKVYLIPYNEIRFFWTATTGTIEDENPLFNTDNPLSGWLPLEATSVYTSFDDNSYTTGFGWFMYRNSVTLESSQESNPIPYTGFDYNTVATIFGDFDSLLNVNELKLVTLQDKYSWLNEALALVKNKLNLTNAEYSVSPVMEIDVSSGATEYLLPADFSDLVYIVDGNNRHIPFVKISETPDLTEGSTAYYLRGRYIGIIGPSTSKVKIRYRSKSERVTSLSTYIDLPDNAYFSLKDFMMFRACLKFNNPLAQTYYESFNNGVNLYIQAAVKRDAHSDTWGIASNANV
jgi:hypothetical protein